VAYEIKVRKEDAPRAKCYAGLALRPEVGNLIRLIKGSSAVWRSSPKSLRF